MGALQLHWPACIRLRYMAYLCIRKTCLWYYEAIPRAITHPTNVIIEHAKPRLACNRDGPAENTDLYSTSLIMESSFAFRVGVATRGRLERFQILWCGPLDDSPEPPRPEVPPSAPPPP